jgi:hypothetical protein
VIAYPRRPAIVTTTEVPRHPRGAWLLLGGILTGLLVASGSFGLWAVLTRPETLRTEAQEQVYQQPVSDIDIAVEASSVTLTSGAEGAVRVQRQLTWGRAKPTLDERIVGRTLQIRVKCPRTLIGRAGHCRVDFAVEVPPGVAVKVNIDGGGIRADRLTGPLQLTTSYADIAVSGTRGPLVARSTIGDVVGVDLGGREVDVKSGRAHVDLRFTVVPDHVRAETQNGDVTVVVPVGGTGVEGYQVRSGTGLGRQDIDIRQDPDGRHTIAAFAGEGDILIRHGTVS